MNRVLDELRQVLIADWREFGPMFSFRHNVFFFKSIGRLLDDAMVITRILFFFFLNVYALSFRFEYGCSATQLHWTVLLYASFFIASICWTFKIVLEFRLNISQCAVSICKCKCKKWNKWKKYFDFCSFFLSTYQANYYTSVRAT